MPDLYNPDAANLGSKTAYVYFALAGLGVVATFFFIPEMKGRKNHEIDKLFDLRVSARKFKHWELDDSGSV